MACACKVQRDLEFLQKKYGTDPKSKGYKSKGNFSLALLLSILLYIISIPIMGILMLFGKRRGKIINVQKLFGLAKHGKK